MKQQPLCSEGHHRAPHTAEAHTYYYLSVTHLVPISGSSASSHQHSAPFAPDTPYPLVSPSIGLGTCAAQWQRTLSPFSGHLYHQGWRQWETNVSTSLSWWIPVCFWRFQFVLVLFHVRPSFASWLLVLLINGGFQLTTRHESNNIE